MAVAAASCLVSTLALMYSFRGDRRKSGVEIRSNFSIATSIASEHAWVSEINLQNEKDRAVTIYKIYMEVGHGIFIEVEDFRDKPLIVAPYGAYHQQYDPVDLYSASMRQVTGVFANSRARRRVVLATSSGRYYAKAIIDTQDPVGDMFLKNYASGVVHPIRLTYRGKGYGSHVRYIVTFEYTDQEDEIVPLYPDDHRIMKFRHFQLTECSMQSRDNLEAFFRKQISKGNLVCDSFNVFDAASSRAELISEYPDVLHIPSYGWFRYNVIFGAWTKWEQIYKKIKNRRFRFQRND